MSTIILIKKIILTLTKRFFCQHRWRLAAHGIQGHRQTHFFTCHKCGRQKVIESTIN